MRHLTASGLALVIATSASAATRYVDVGLSTGTGDGTSWANAYRGPSALQTALTVAVAGDEVWVRSGTYLPSANATRTSSFTMKTGVAIYGGFAGTETQLSQRDWRTNVTVLSGDFLGNDSGAANTSENAYHVVVGTGAGSTAILDGFHVRGGNANLGSGNNDRGGGILVISSGAPTVRNCVFSQNRCTFGGGAGYIFSAQATFTDCEFSDNVGGSYGGAFDTNAVTSTFTRCVFRNNSAVRAGAVETFGGGNTTYSNCLFAGNRATGAGGGAAIWIGVSSAIVRAYNCTFAGNVATSTAGGVNTTTGGTLNAYNCIFWGNTGPGGATAANQVNAGGGANVVAHCTVQGGFAGTGNLATDPLFAGASAGDYSLSESSPAIDSGNNTYVPAGGMATDLAGGVRYFNAPGVPDTGVGNAPIVDRGCYEFVVTVPPCQGDVNGNGTVDGIDLGILLGGWGTSSGDIDGNGTVDGMDLGILLGNWGPC